MWPNNTRIPSRSAVLSFSPKARTAKSFTGAGVRSITAPHTTVTGPAAGRTGPANRLGHGRRGVRGQEPGRCATCGAGEGAAEAAHTRHSAAPARRMGETPERVNRTLGCAPVAGAPTRPGRGAGGARRRRRHLAGMRRARWNRADPGRDGTDAPRRPDRGAPPGPRVGAIRGVVRSEPSMSAPDAQYPEPTSPRSREVGVTTDMHE